MLRSLVRAILPRRFRPSVMAMREVTRLSAGKILAGPFAGMVSITSPDDFTDYAMLLGTYELELRDVIERICAVPPDLIVDVGAAQGYYVIGFALRCPTVDLVAFESTQSGRDQLERAASANGVLSRIQLLGHCDGAALNAALSPAGRHLVIMDIEGGEEELLDPGLVPALKTCEILLEEHSSMRPGLDRLIRSRFEPTHRIDFYPAHERSEKDLPADPAARKNRRMVRLMNEGRPSAMGWFHMMPSA